MLIPSLIAAFESDMKAKGMKLSAADIYSVNSTSIKDAILQFGGGCQGCGMVDVTLKDGIEKTLLEQLPELAGVKDMTDHSLDEHAFYKDES